MDIVSTKVTNTIATNMSINSDNKNVRYKIDCYILKRVLLVITLLLIITITCYHYAKHRSKEKGIDALAICNIKWKIMNLKKFILKIARVIILIIKLEDYDIDNILIDEESHENILLYDNIYKTLIGGKPLRIRFDKIDGFIKIYNGTKYIVLFGSEKRDASYNRIRYIIQLRSSITYTFSYYYAKIKVDSYDSLPIEKRLCVML